MNGSLVQASPSRRQPNRGGGGDGARTTRGGGVSRGRGRGRLAPSKLSEQLDGPSSAMSNGDGSITGTDSSDEADAARQERFSKTEPGNQYEQLKVKRDVERKSAIAKGLIDDPEKPRSLSDAIHFVGTCPTMCPEFEMHQREFQNNVEKWEIDPSTGRIGKSRAVKAFHRPAAGNEQPLPSDVRPPAVLVKTLDYLFSTILEGADDLYSTHAFIRDRTRSIRQDFTVQNYRGREAIECHERIARYHILCLHALCDNPNFSEQQEMEQLRKVLQSLMEFYKDTKQSSSPLPLPNEAEFRAYYALVFLRDHDVSRQLQTLSDDLFFSAATQRSLRLRSLAQRSNDKFVQNNAEAAPNSFVRFFKETQQLATFLESCILETWFGSVRTGALKALRQALGVKAVQISQVSVPTLVNMLGFDDVEQLVAFCTYLSLELVYDEEGEPKAVWFKRSVAWEEPASNLHLYSRTIVEAKRGDHSYQSIINGLAPQKPASVLRQPKPWTSYNVQPKRTSVRNSTQRYPAPVANGFQAERKQPAPAFMPQDRVQPAQPFSAPLQGGSTPKIQPTHFEDGASQPILKSPAPKRVIKSPILGFQSSQPSNPTADSLPIPKAPSLFGANFNQNPQSQPPAPFAFTPTPTISFPSSPSNGLPKLGTPDIPATITPLPLSEESSLSLKKHRQSLFERQEKLLHDELAFQDRERQSILNQHKREQQKSFELARQQTLERAQQRLKESVLLQNEKIETQERQHHERIMKEQRKVQTEKTVQFYAEEIVNSIVQEHVLEVSASELAVAFHRRVFLKNVLHRLSKICKRSVLRKKVQLEQIAQARRRKMLVDRALAELDNGERGPLSKKPRRRSQRIRLGETEEELTEVLAKASQEGKVLWKPMDLQQILSPFVDRALTRGGLYGVEWNLLMLSVEDQIGEETRWLRTKFGFPNETVSRITVPSDTADLNVIWSPVMQFTGTLDNVGALIFVCESGRRNGENPGAKALLHEVVRQMSLQSRYKYPILVVNFNNTSANASDIARELDLQTLSQVTTSVPAFQVLTIGSLGDTNLEASVRSYVRHITATPNDTVQDREMEEKKRKRGTMRNSSVGGSRSVSDIHTAGDESPSKKLRNSELDIETIDGTRKVLPKSIASLYESILSAQKELEAGKGWEAEAFEKM